jgi:hypothetical protein
MRTASASSELRHPVPDLQSLQGAYVQNVERLEERAERMSLGSDIGEEIRKLHLEQKLSDSRRSSLLSNIDPQAPPRSRNVSTGSFSNSIVEVNNAARYGGYSPNAFMASPIGSMRSGSWSHVSYTASFSGSRSISKGSRLGVISNSEFGDDDLVASPTDDPTIHVSSAQERTPRPLSTHTSSTNLVDPSQSHTDGHQKKRISRLPSDASFTNLYNQMTESNSSAAHLAAARIPSDTSFTDIYDQIAGEIHDQLDSPRAPPSMSNSSIQHTPVNELSRQLETTLSSPQPNDTNRQPEDSPPPPPLHKSFHLVSNIPAAATDNQKDVQALAPPIELDRQTENEDFHAFDGHDPHDRPPTAASTDTFTQAQVLFRDFDGAHYAPSIRESIVEEVDEAVDDEEEEDEEPVLRMLPQRESRIPPPADGMVYYPAPVPRMLNLPQKISQAPSAATQARRRTQLLDALPAEHRKSAPWLTKDRRGSDAMSDLGGNARESRMNLASLPPQLRASMFFEHGGMGRPEVAVKDGSAMATFDDLLDASARAPVSAFTDHPIVGHMGAGVYKKEAANRSSASLQRLQEKKEKSRGSFLGLRRSSISSTNALDDGDKTPGRLQKRNTKNLSMNLDDTALARGPDGEIIGDLSGPNTPLPRTPKFDENGEPLDDDHVSDDEDEEEDEETGDEGEDDEEAYFGPPTTLLAELAMRKKEQKSRNRNAFSSFPNGMHSTLLELDAVAQLEKSKRKKTRVALAWEDPSLRAAEDAAGDDEDVPLGVLFKEKSSKVKNQLRDQGLADWDRPLGLIEKRELEDNEPLSRRRNRLLGVNPNAVRKAPSVHVTAMEDADAASSEDEGETLAQRVRRLKDKKGLDDAIGVGERPVSMSFTAELLGELGVQHTDGKKSPLSQGTAEPSVPNRGQSETPDEDETLGQRRARLQREAQQQQQQQQQEPQPPRPRPQQTRRASQMSLGADLKLNKRASTLSFSAEQTLVNQANRLSMNPEQALNSRTSQMFLPTQDQGQQPPLRVSRSMADLLAAHPLGQNQPRKVSNDLLVSLLPADSLLAKHEERTQGRKAQIQESNRRSSGILLAGQKPFIDVPDRPLNDRRKSGGFKGGLYNNGTGGITPASQIQQPQIPMANPNAMFQQAQMQMQPPLLGYGMPMGIAAMSSPNLMMPYAQPQMPIMGMNGFAGMSNPNLMSGMNGFAGMSNPNLLQGHGMNDYGAGGGNRFTYPYQQNPVYPAMPHQVATGDPGIDNKTRERVDAWIQGVPS